MMKKILFLDLLTAAFASLAAGCAPSSSDIPAVTNFDLDRYLGTWYEIARLPHRFERGMDHVRAEYSKNADGSVKVVNHGVKNGSAKSIVGRARLKAATLPPTGELEVSFFRPFYADYRIIELDPQYRYAVVTGSTRNYLWILSRTPQLPSDQLAAIIRRLEKLSFDTAELEFPRQQN